MIYLLDASVLITANNLYYPIDRVPEFWEWVLFHADSGNIRMPLEIIDEILAGTKKDDLLVDWMKDHKEALLLDEEVEAQLLREVVTIGYAPDLTDDELEQIGQDPFVIAYARAKPDRSVVTTEVPKPSKTRQNRQIPDVCDSFSVDWLHTFGLTRALDFRTSWRKLI